MKNKKHKRDSESKYNEIIKYIKKKTRENKRVYIKIDVPKKRINKILKELCFVNFFQRDIFTYIPQSDKQKPNQIELLFIEESLGMGGWDKRIIMDFDTLNELIPHARWFYGIDGLFNGGENLKENKRIL